MRKQLCILLLLFTAVPAYSQKQGRALIDSLLTELPGAQEDTNKVNMLATLCFNYYPINPDTGIRYGMEGLKLAEKLHWQYGIAQTNGYMGINYAVKSEYARAIEHFLRALKAHESLGNKSNIATTLVNIGNIHLLTSNFPKALEYYLRALAIQEEIDNKKGIALSLSNIGLIESPSGNCAFLSGSTLPQFTPTRIAQSLLSATSFKYRTFSRQGFSRS